MNSAPWRWRAARQALPAASEHADEAREFVQRIADAIGADVSAAAVDREGMVTVTCTGADLAAQVAAKEADIKSGLFRVDINESQPAGSTTAEPVASSEG